ncbi:hypothetical protein [Lysinibacillus capsici]|uniref:hypothetical protein n=1 Tax=Lysinibacillus capsici TaxID=2115968 RepID=UPI002DBDA078|nr:hypothetical protein [Lysinibacillus capsici]MEC1304291.1 hypothetical protein [Lysinibacillus capsici]
MDKIVIADELIFMREDLEEQLLQRFPWLEQSDLDNGKEQMDIVPCFVGVGWFNLLSNMFLEIENLYNSLNEPLEKISFYEIKEKQGLLRVYMKNGVTGLQEILNKYEILSGQVCEICSEIGELQDGAWTVVVCKDCSL